MYKLILLACVLAVAAAAPTYDLYHPHAYSYSSTYIQHPTPVLKSYAHPVVVPVAPVVKTYHAPIVPLIKTYPHPIYHPYPLTYKPAPLVYAPHYY